MILVNTLLKLVRMYDYFWTTLYNFIPAHVSRIDHINSETRIITPIYKCSTPDVILRGDRWNRSTIDIEQDGFYHIQVWSKGSQLSLFLKGTKLLDAIGGPQTWYFSSRGLYEKLKAYTEFKKDGDILSITINGDDVTKQLSPYFSSLSITHNATATATTLLQHLLECVEHEEIDNVYDRPVLQQLTFIQDKKQEDDTIIMTDYLLMEKGVTNNNELFSD